MLDLGFVRGWVEDCYAERGRPSIDPVVFFKLQLVMFYEGIRSERQLIESVSLNLAHRWYLGCALDENLPDHSSLTRIRQRLGTEIFERFFPEPEALPGRDGMGAAPRPVRHLRGPPKSALFARGHLLMTDLGSGHSHPPPVEHRDPGDGAGHRAIFQQAGALPEPARPRAQDPRAWH